jgi:putative tryptophan/tyrosine transport system substrate-binding protein
MRRRDVFSGVSLILLAAPRWARAQPSSAPKVHRIALVSSSVPPAEINEAHPYWRGFFHEMSRAGYAEGANLTVERYSAEGQTEQLAEFAESVVRSRPDLIYTLGTALVAAFKSATSTIPIVAHVGDPIASGFAESLARPGGNFTGIVSDAGTGHVAKGVEFLKEAVPAASRLGFIVPSVFLQSPYSAVTREAAQVLGLSIVDAPLGSPLGETEYRRAFSALAQERVDAVILSNYAGHYHHRQLLVKLASAARLPTLYPYREFIEVGGLMAYAPDDADLMRRAAGIINLILNGANPGDIPLYRATKFVLSINLKAARTLGLQVPSLLLARADEVIE